MGVMGTSGPLFLSLQATVQKVKFYFKKMNYLQEKNLTGLSECIINRSVQPCQKT